MADRLTPEQRRLNMSRVRAKNTGPEMIVRRILHGRGFRFRLHRRDLPGKPDVVLPRYRTAILIHGCFWHGHGCSLFKVPATRTAFWLAKIETNRRRDAEALSRLKALGWRTLCVWECAMKGTRRMPETGLAHRIVSFVISNESDSEIAEASTSNARPEEGTGA